MASVAVEVSKYLYIVFLIAKSSASGCTRFLNDVFIALTHIEYFVLVLAL